MLKKPSSNHCRISCFLTLKNTLHLVEFVVVLSTASFLIYISTQNPQSDWFKPEVLGATVGALFAATAGAFIAYRLELKYKHKIKNEGKNDLIRKIIYTLKFEVLKLNATMKHPCNFDQITRLNLYFSMGAIEKISDLVRRIDNSEHITQDQCARLNMNISSVMFNLTILNTMLQNQKMIEIKQCPPLDNTIHTYQQSLESKIHSLEAELGEVVGYNPDLINDIIRDNKKQ